jgi:5-methylcytosine-specific restriction protein A
VQIGDLPSRVSASKADWIAGTTWLGFTPRGGSLSARAQCESTIQSQLVGGAYVIEYITETAEKPNAGFEDDPRYLEERRQHQENKGRFIAVHKLRHSSRPLVEILGQEEFSRLQDMWAQGQKRWRWSVAFPIVESFDIVGKPRAAEVLSQASYRRLYAHSSATLRPLNDDERRQIQDLQLSPRPALNSWIAIEDEFAAAEASDIPRNVQRLIDNDLGLAALEGETEEQKAKRKKRAAWLANRFVLKRVREKALHCDLCPFDPSTVLNAAHLKLRSALDVHHKFPLEEGIRYTTISDFALLCPTCHRMEHQLLKKGGSFFAKDETPHLFAPLTLTE